MKVLIQRQFCTQMGVSMRKDRYHKNLRKEKIVMGASACLVLAALTMTGIYVKNKGADELSDGYQMDYETLDSSMEEIESFFPTFPSESEEDMGISSILGNDPSADDALDYAPDYEETDTLNILIPGLTREEADLLADEAAMAADAGRISQDAETEPVDPVEEAGTQNVEVAQAEVSSEEVQEGVTQDVLVQGGAEEMPTVTANSFVAGEALSWPISGKVLISFSMDKTVYFATLQQYKYSPGMVMQANVGDEITSVAAGTVIEVSEDAEIGKYVKVDIGGGYTTIYGQLQNITAYEGGSVDVGSVLGYVAEPTKYYSVEGANAYFALTKDGEPADPVAPLW